MNKNLEEAVFEFINDPLGFVYFIYPWKQGILKDEVGPDKWQVEVLRLIGEKCLSADEAVRIAIRSGHGIGKSALVSWLVHWFMSTRPHPQIVVTANTKAQLESKTWRELAKWHKLALNSNWFKHTATKFYRSEHSDTWFATAIPWSKERSEAFAGTHEEHVLIIFDEASSIDDVIWEVAEGALTTKGAMWLTFGNPTRPTGRFSECFKKYRHRWLTYEVDSRDAKKANQTQIQQWIDDYGIDSDFVKVRVRGIEPSMGIDQMISSLLVLNALGKSIHVSQYEKLPKVMGVDIARQGDDQSVIYKRQGLATFEPIKMRIPNNMDVAARVAREIDSFRPDGVFIDAGGGFGVIDRLRQLGYRVVEVPFGSSATDDKHWANKRAEMWGGLKEWLLRGGCLPNDRETRDDLISPECGFDKRGRILMESKADMKARGLASPDCGDALALTFAHPVQVNNYAYLYATHEDEDVKIWSPFDKEYA